jgi:hypothetical protein
MQKIPYHRWREDDPRTLPGVPIASAQETSIRETTGNAVEEHEVFIRAYHGRNDLIFQMFDVKTFS